MDKAWEQQSAFLPALARLGLFRLYFASGGEIDFQDLPPRQHDELAAFWSAPEYFQNVRAEPGEETHTQGLGCRTLATCRWALSVLELTCRSGWLCRQS